MVIIKAVMTVEVGRSQMSRQAAKTDTHHAEIRDALRKLGYTVIDTARMGDGFPDLVVVDADGFVTLIEVKSDGGGVTEAEAEFMLKLINPAYRIVFSAEQAIRIMRHE